MTKQVELENGLESNPRLVDLRKEVQLRLREAEYADAETHKKVTAYGKKVNELESRLPGERTILERMKSDCLKLQGENRARKQAAAVAVEKQLHDDVMAGKIGVVEYHEKMTAHMAKVKSEADQVDREIETTISAVREKALTVLEMEVELWEARVNYYYLMGYPSEVGLGELKKMIQEISYRSQALASRYQNSSGELAKVKDRHDRAKGKALTAGWVDDNLTVEQVKALPMLPEIPAKYLPSLSVLISEIEAEEKKRLEDGQQPGLYYIACSFMHGISQPWNWLCRNVNSPVIQMSKTKPMTGSVTMSDLPKKSMEV